MFRKNKAVPRPTHEPPAWATDAGRRIGGYLQRRTDGMSPARLKTLCIVFVLLAGGGSSWVLVHGLTKPSVPAWHSTAGGPAILPAYPTPPDNEQTLETARAQIAAFLRRLDSLKDDPAGRALYDSLRRARPGLFDTLEQLDRTYRLNLYPKK